MFWGKKKSSNPLDEVKNWYSDRYQFVVVQRNFLILVTLLSLAGLGATTFAVARLTESKTFEPYVIEVEEKTGITTLVDRYSKDRYTADETVVKYFAYKYVQAREGYDDRQYRYNYSEIVRVMSSRDIYAKFRKFISVENPRSPINLGRKFKRSVHIKSMVFLEPKKLQARVLLRDTEHNGKKEIDNHAVVTIDFDFLELELNSQGRYINPLGFQVLGYTIDEDVSWKDSK